LHVGKSAIFNSGRADQASDHLGGSVNRPYRRVLSFRAESRNLSLFLLRIGRHVSAGLDMTKGGCSVRCPSPRPQFR